MPTPYSAQIIIVEVTNKGYLGKCDHYPSPTSVYTFVDILLCEENWDGFTSNKRKWVCGHELGHCFGLDESASYAIMNEEWLYASPVPTSDDEDGIQAIYE